MALAVCEEFLRDLPSERPCLRLSLACQAICPCGCNAPAAPKALRSAPAEANRCGAEQPEGVDTASLGEAAAVSQASAADEVQSNAADGGRAEDSLEPGWLLLPSLGQEAGGCLGPGPSGGDGGQADAGGGERGGDGRQAQPARPAFLRPWTPTHTFEEETCQCSGHCGNSGHRYWGGCSEIPRVVSDRPRRRLAGTAGGQTECSAVATVRSASSRLQQSCQQWQQ